MSSWPASSESSPALEDFATLMRLLPRSATGQTISTTSASNGTRRHEAEGAERPITSWTTGAPDVSGSPGRLMLWCASRCGAW